MGRSKPSVAIRLGKPQKRHPGSRRQTCMASIVVLLCYHTPSRRSWVKSYGRFLGQEFCLDLPARFQYTAHRPRWTHRGTPSDTGTPAAGQPCVVRAREHPQLPRFQAIVPTPPRPPPSCGTVYFSSAAVSYPAGTGSAQIPRSMAPDSGRARRLSASRSQKHLACLISRPRVLTKRCRRLVKGQLPILWGSTGRRRRFSRL